MPTECPIHARERALAAMLLLAACSSDATTAPRDGARLTESAPATESGVAIAVQPGTTYQRMIGWEATTYAGEDFASFPRWRDAILDSAVSLGITRLRLELRSGAESTRDWYGEWLRGSVSDSLWRCARYATEDDGGGPAATSAAGYRWTHVDSQMDGIVMPLRQRLAARGERLHLALNYVSFERTVCTGFSYGLHHDPEEYAELMLAAFEHLQAKYGLTPDALEVILEPDNSPFWASGTHIGRAIVAAAGRLRAAGFAPEIVAPSTTSMANTAPYFDSLAAVPGALAAVREIAYHRYAGVSSSALQAIAARASRHGLRTAMLERIGATQWDLIGDLTTGGNSSWQQFTIGGPAAPGSPDRGAGYFRVDTIANVVTAASRTRHLRHFFRAIRPGAVRLRATTSNATLAKSVAFRNATGATVLVASTSGAALLSVSGLPAGDYAVSYTTATETMRALPTATMPAGGSITVRMPAAGTMSVVGQ